MDNVMLKNLRKEIDEVDRELLAIMAKRVNLVREIGKLKKENSINPLDNKRWEKVLHSRLSVAKSLNLSEEFIKNLYTLIHKHSLKVQKNKK